METRNIGWGLVGLVVVGAVAAVVWDANSPRRPAPPPESPDVFALTAVAVRAGVDQSIAGGFDPKDALRFSYSVSEGAPEQFVAIAGRDTQGKLHWFHPRYEEPFSKPQSLATGAGVTDQPLRPVRMQLPPGPMEICAMFTKEQMDVSVIDGWFIVAGSWWPHGRRACLEISVKPTNNSR